MRYQVSVGSSLWRAVRRVLPLLVAIAITPSARGQGGPPLVTDDPGTPGPRRWEVNVAFTFEDRGGFQTFETPIIDANYGIGDRLQLKIEIPWIVRNDAADVSGIGSPLFGVKYRVCDAPDCGVAIGVYPQVEVRLSSRSARLGLVDEETSVLVPLLLQRDFALLSANIEAGYVFRAGESGEWVWGLALGHTFGELEALAEVFGSAAPRNGAEWAWNAGLRWHAANRFALLLSAGKGLSTSSREPRARALAYLGTQFLF